VLFTQDRTVVPKESSWFGSYAPKEEGEDDALGAFFDLGPDEEAIVPMRKQPLYVEDWIGLRTLDESGRVKLVSCEGEHMHISTECWQPLVKKYVGSRP
jgi:palmitoyl-protein thioesterase